MAEEQPDLPVQPSLIGDNLYLRPAVAEDISATYHWTLQSEPQSQTCRPFVIKTPQEAAESFAAVSRSLDKMQFMAVPIEGGKPVAQVSYFDLNQQNRSVELGLIVDPEQRKQGFGAEALRIMIKYLFRHRGLNKVYAQTAACNQPTVKLLEKLGFKRDATLRDHYFIDGQWFNGYIYSLPLYDLDF